MTMASPMTIFDVGTRAMSAQLVRMNAAASNLANAGTVAGSEAEAYRPLRAVFSEQLDAGRAMSTVKVDSISRSTAVPVREHVPDHPMADANGDIWTAPVDQNAEMIEMMESSRQYQNMVEAMQTAKQLMLETMRMK